MIQNKKENFIKNILYKQKNKRLKKYLLNSIKNNQLKIYYQPKYNIDTNQIVGSEALIRWIHPTKGIITPNEFIHIAEESGYINAIGRWVFEEVCKNLNIQQKNNIKSVPISINLSRIELYQDNLINTIKENMNKYNINPTLIEIEITETTALKDTKYINEKLNAIKNLGIKVAMDDFGTGNSNLSGLKDLNIDILKLDKSLLQDIEVDLKAKTIVKHIMSLSSDLNIKTVCEGVENSRQIEVLKELKVKIVQGYVFSKPVEEKKYNKLLELSNIGSTNFSNS